jgi:hypothetical protein
MVKLFGSTAIHLISEGLAEKVFPQNSHDLLTDFMGTWCNGNTRLLQSRYRGSTPLVSIVMEIVWFTQIIVSPLYKMVLEAKAVAALVCGTSH